MSKISNKIDEVLEEAETCELIAKLAVNTDARQRNQRRAAELRKLAERAQVVDCGDRKGDLPDAGRD